MWHRLYKAGSSLEGGTLQQLRNLINRRNVSASTSITGHVNDVQDFLLLVTNCHIIAATMHYFSMANIDDEPHTSAFPSDIHTMPAKRKWWLLHSELCQIVDKYIIPRQYILKEGPRVQEAVSSDHANPHVRRMQQDHAYTSTMPVYNERRLPQTVAQHVPRSAAPEPIRRVAVDSVFNYASAVLNDGLLLLEFSDAIREGDGLRILRCWRAMLIYFHYGRHSNYAKEAILLQAQVSAIASPRVAQQITWSRVVSSTGGRGCNIPVDLYNEYLNRALKTAVAGMGANVAPSTILQCGKSLKGLMGVVDNYDDQHDIHPQSSEHTRSSLKKDEDAVIEELVRKSRVFDYIPGRDHATFKSIAPNPATSIDKTKLFETIKRYQADIRRKAAVAKLYKHSL